MSRTVYLLATNMVAGKPLAVAQAVQIKTGVGDGVTTEVLEGLNEGDVVITAAIVANQTTSQVPTGTTPFGGPGFGRGRPR